MDFESRNAIEKKCRDSSINLKCGSYGRLALSQRSCRIQLPSDVILLKNMTPVEFLSEYCLISKRRLNQYKRIYESVNPDKAVSYPGMLEMVREAMDNIVSVEDVEEVCRMLLVNRRTEVDFRLFSIVAALTERLVYPKFVTEHTRDLNEYTKDELEKADFSCLLWRLDTVRMDGDLRTLIDRIAM